MCQIWSPNRIQGGTIHSLGPTSGIQTNQNYSHFQIKEEWNPKFYGGFKIAGKLVIGELVNLSSLDFKL